MNGQKAIAPVRWQVVAAALAAILLLSVGVCALHRMNAVALRGTLAVSAHETTDGKEENLMPILDDPWADAGCIHITGALLRMGQSVGAVNVRVGLIPEQIDEGNGVKALDEAILLSTQMVRRSDLARQYGVDDHCGFYALVRKSDLKGEGWQYRVVLADTVEGETRLIETGMRIVNIDGGLAYARTNAPEEDTDEDE